MGPALVRPSGGVIENTPGFERALLRRTGPYLLLILATYLTRWALQRAGDSCDSAYTALPYCVAGVGHGEATVPVFALLSGVVVIPAATVAAGAVVGLQRGFDWAVLGACVLFALILPISLWGADGAFEPAPTFGLLAYPLGVIYVLVHLGLALLGTGIGSGLRNRRQTKPRG